MFNFAVLKKKKMSKDTVELVVDKTTESKIKDAACVVFTKKGYSATRTRDIAEEADINLSLLNYYFRSKEKLFQIVMNEKMELMFGKLQPIVNDKESNLETKLNLLIQLYMDMLETNPHLPIFIMSEINNDHTHCDNQSSMKDLLGQSVLMQQLKVKKPSINPYHFLLNIMSLCIFPYIAKPIFNATDLLNEIEFQQLMTERKTLIPKWAESFLLEEFP